MTLAVYNTAALPDGVRGFPQVSGVAPQYWPSHDPIANPERGFYLHLGDCDKVPFQARALARQRDARKISLVLCIFYLEEFKDRPISEAQLAFFQRQADAVRAGGLKMVLRFAYTQEDASGEGGLPPGDDAPLPRVQQHLTQLEPYLRQNEDVIAVLESGFVGTWGEGSYSQNFGHAGAEDWAGRKAVVGALLRILPERMVLLRRPEMKMRMFFPSPEEALPVSAELAYGEAPVARVGHHNDCFLASPDDKGTYKEMDRERAYLAEDTRYVAMGGETCVPNPPRSLCGEALGEPDRPGDALGELERFHYSYLNAVRSKAVLDSWTADGCMAEIKRRLGYRFSLESSSFPASVKVGSKLPAEVGVRNTGWAAPINARPVYLVLRHRRTKAVHTFRLATDARAWQAGAPTLVRESVPLPADLPTGTYQLLLWLPDPSERLRHRPEYAVRMANHEVWDVQAGKETGFNRLWSLRSTAAGERYVLSTVEVTP